MCIDRAPSEEYNVVVFADRLPHNPEGRSSWFGPPRVSIPPQSTAPLVSRPAVSGITIDPGIHFDIDDAIGVTRDGLSRVLNISIADVASQLAKDDPIDLAAQERIASRYYGESQDPMFPAQLAEFDYSLREHHPRAAITVSFPYTLGGAFAAPEIRLTTVTSSAQLTYGAAADRLRYRDGNGIDELLELAAVAPLLFRLRCASANLLDRFERSGILLGEDGHPRQVKRANFISHFIVQECMIAANMAIAELLRGQGAHALFRNQQPMALRDSGFLNQYPALAKFIDTFQGNDLRIGGRALYGVQSEGHFHLNLPAYIHATSPIRRYADVVNQRILCAIMRGEPPPYSADELLEIAAHINSTPIHRKRHERRSGPLTTDAELFIEAAGTAAVSDGQIRGLLVEAARGVEMNADFWREVAVRIEGRRLHTGDHFRLLQSGVELTAEVAAALMKYYTAQPHLAPQLFALLRSHGVIGSVQLVEEWRPGRATVRFQATVKWRDGVRHEATTPFSAMKRALRDAHLRLLGSILGMPLPDPEPVTPEPSVEGAAAGAAPDPSSDTDLVQVTSAKEVRRAEHRFRLRFRTSPSRWLKAYCRQVAGTPLELSVTSADSHDGAPHQATWTAELPEGKVAGSGCAESREQAIELAALELIHRLIRDFDAVTEAVAAVLDPIGSDMRNLGKRFSPFDLLKTVCAQLGLPPPTGRTTSSTVGEETFWHGELRFTAPNGDQIVLTRDADAKRGIDSALALQALDRYFSSTIRENPGEWTDP